MLLLKPERYFDPSCRESEAYVREETTLNQEMDQDDSPVSSDGSDGTGSVAPSDEWASEGPGYKQDSKDEKSLGEEGNSMWRVARVLRSSSPLPPYRHEGIRAPIRDSYAYILFPWTSSYVPTNMEAE